MFYSGTCNIVLDVQGDGDSFLRDVILSVQNEIFWDWFAFGLQLGFEVNELRVLQDMAYKTADPMYGIREVLFKWRMKFPQAGTWDTIIEALKRINAVRLARQLEKQHRQT